MALGLGKNKAQRIMRKYGIKPPRRKGKKFFLTRSVSSRRYTNLIKKLVANKPNQIFVSDLTYLPYQDKNIYLAAEENMVRISVSAKGSSWQNGCKESFFGRFKDENGDLNRFETLGELVEEIYAYVHYYNHLRIHTSLKMPPVRFKQQYLEGVSQKPGS